MNPLSLRELSRDSRGPLLGAIALSALATGAGVALLMVSAWLITSASYGPPILTLEVAIVAVRALGIGRGVFRYAERYVGHDAALRFLAAVRTAVYGRLERLTPAGTGDLSDGQALSRFVADTDALADLYVRVLIPLGGVAVVVAALLTTTGLLLPAAGVVLAVVLAVGALVAPWLTTRASGGAERAGAQQRGRLTEQYVDALRGSADILAFGAVDAVAAELAGTDRALSRSAGRSAWAIGAGAGLAALAVGLGVPAMAAVAAGPVADGGISGPVYAVLVFAVLASQELVALTPAGAAARQRVRAAAARLTAVLQRPEVPGGPVTAPRTDAVLEAEDLAVSWASGEPAAIADVTVTLRPGARLGIAGPSGSGKSTLLTGLLGLLPVTGRLAVRGAGDAEAVREVVAASLQDAHVFATTLAENLRLGRPTADEAQLWAALDAVALGDWARGLPLGLRTPVGPDGNALSGGQRQRVCLARALLRETPVLLLDEPGEHLDTATADALLADALAAAGPRAVTVVSHRLAALADVDEILVVADGHVVERGSHGDLLAAGGWYARTWRDERAADGAVG